MGRLAGKVAIVTGAGNGMGRCEALMFAREGAKVIATDVDPKAAQATVADIGDDALALGHDVSSEADWAKTVESAIEHFGQIDILVNNAGIHPSSRLADTPSDEWNRVIAVNMNGAFFGTRAVIPHMKAAGGGSIINISSIAGLIGGSPGHYATAKAGLLGLTRSTAIDHARDQIRANAICPGLIVTDLTAQALADPERRALIESKVPLPYFGKPEDIAYAVLFLASDESRFVTGGQLIVDGGTTAA